MSAKNQAFSKRSEKTRRLIIDNAAKIFFKRGFRNVSVEELCKIIRVSKGTFYKFFPNREALVETVFDEISSTALPAIIANLNSDRNVKQIIENHYKLMVDLFMSRVSARMLADTESLMPQMWERIEKAREDEAKARIKMFKRGQKDGSIRKDIDPVVMGVLFEETMASIFRPGFLISNDLTLKQASSAIKAILLDGIMATKQKGG